MVVGNGALRCIILMSLSDTVDEMRRIHCRSRFLHSIAIRRSRWR